MSNSEEIYRKYNPMNEESSAVMFTLAKSEGRQEGYKEGIEAGYALGVKAERKRLIKVMAESCQCDVDYLCVLHEIIFDLEGERE